MNFLISGSETSIGAIAGALAIARWRVIAVVTGVLWIGAIGFGYLYNLMIAMGVGYCVSVPNPSIRTEKNSPLARGWSQPNVGSLQ